MAEVTGTARFALYEVPESVLSSYNNQPLHELKCGHAAPDMVEGLRRLAEDLSGIRVTDCFRDIGTQEKLRRKYENWVNAGKPKEFNPAFMKNAFVAIPGKSMHNGGRAIDLDIGALRVAYGEQYLDEFWPLAAARGFTPVIARPIEGSSECWHFDFKGYWQPVFDRLGYEQGVLAANCSVNMAGAFQSQERKIQAHVVRLGKDIGEIDGILGKRSRAALLELGLDKTLVENTKLTATRVQAMADAAALLEDM